MQAQPTAGGDDDVAVVEGIAQLRQAGVDVCRGGVELGRALHAERLVGPLGIELVHEGVEALLLLQAVEARRTSGLLLEGEVHALSLIHISEPTRRTPTS